MTRARSREAGERREFSDHQDPGCRQCDIMAAASNKRVTFTLSDGHSDNVSDGDHDNPFQAPDLAEDAEMILNLWRSGSLHTYPAASLSPPVSIRKVSVWPLTSIEYLTRVKLFS